MHIHKTPPAFGRKNTHFNTLFSKSMKKNVYAYIFGNPVHAMHSLAIFLQLTRWSKNN